MLETTARGFAYVLVALAFSSLVLLRFIELPGYHWACAFHQSSATEHSLQYSFPFVGSSLTTGGVDPVSGKDDPRIRIISAFFRTIIVAFAKTETRWSETQTSIVRSQPIWLLHCSMRC